MTTPTWQHLDMMRSLIWKKKTGFWVDYLTTNEASQNNPEWSRDVHHMHLFLSQVYLSRPAVCPQGLYELMLSCWNRDCKLRPSFANIHSFLTEDAMNMVWQKNDRKKVDLFAWAVKWAGVVEGAFTGTVGFARFCILYFLGGQGWDTAGSVFIPPQTPQKTSF